jgi:hypothetical protein
VGVVGGPVRLDYMGMPVALVHRGLVVDRSPVMVSDKLGIFMSSSLLEEQNVRFRLVHFVVLPTQALRES